MNLCTGSESFNGSKDIRTHTAATHCSIATRSNVYIATGILIQNNFPILCSIHLKYLSDVFVSMLLLAEHLRAVYD